ncbi:hypothetical protein IWX76_002249 [Pedobacter sp. CAN_A7]|uniref:hypothetical protein n=1 Tax=Pedobacter sp. CAN_A7 TaxID=2787722 RepID=UPI0018CAF9B5
MDNEIEDNLKGRFGGADFAVPDNYFEQLNQEIQTRIAVERLKALHISNGFTVPELYFEQLHTKINSKIQQPAVKQAKIIRLWQTDLFKYATAACFILVAASGLYINNQQSIPAQPVATELSYEQILFELNEDQVIDAVNDDQLTNTTAAANEKELEEYILNNYSQSDIVTNL